MQTNLRPDYRPLLVVAVLALLGGCWLASSPSTSTPDDALVSLVGRLTALQVGSSILAVSIVSAAAILAAVAIPVVTVIVVLRRTPRAPDEPEAAKRLHATPAPPLASAGSLESEERLKLAELTPPNNSPRLCKLERGTSQTPKGTPLRTSLLTAAVDARGNAQDARPEYCSVAAISRTRHSLEAR